MPKPVYRQKLKLACEDLKNLQASGLTDETIRANLLHTKGDALVFPYRNLEAEVNGFARTRPHNPRIIDGKAVKYEQPKGEPCRAYYPAASLQKLCDDESIVFITEGEKKALALSQLDLAAIGLGGVWCWKVKDTDDLIPDLEAINWDGRDIYIAFDFDKKLETRRQVNEARKRLAKALKAAGAKEVYSINLPPGPDGDKQGVDDFLVANGADAFFDLIESANPTLPANSSSKKGAQGAQGSQNYAQILLGLAIDDSELCHTPEGVTFATIFRNGHRENLRIRSKPYREYLAKRFYDETGNAIGSQTMQDVLSVLEGKARFDGPTVPLFIRIAGHEGRIYLDLCDEEWRAVEISAKGWTIIDNPPVRFRRVNGMLPLPEPERGGTIEELRPFVNVKEEGWVLLISWIVAAFRPTGPYALLKLIGEQGSAKTTTAEVIRKCIDPNAALLRRPPRSDRDLMISANNGWIAAFDNLSYVTPELSDALCCLATGGGYATRALYTDDDENIIVAERPIILNGIEDIGTRSDLLDRCLMVELPRIEANRRRDEEIFWREFEEARPRILGAFLDAVSAALKRLPKVKKSNTAWPRMADYAQWSVAAEEALGMNPGQFLAVYIDNRQSANQTALESSPVVIALYSLLKRFHGSFEGTATKLLEEISIGEDTRAKGWPKSPRVLSGMLARIAPNLRAAGITIEQHESGWGNEKRKVWKIVSFEGAIERERKSPNIYNPCTPCNPSPSKTLKEALRAGRTGR